MGTTWRNECMSCSLTLLQSYRPKHITSPLSKCHCPCRRIKEKIEQHANVIFNNLAVLIYFLLPMSFKCLPGPCKHFLLPLYAKLSISSVILENLMSCCFIWNKDINKKILFEKFTIDSAGFWINVQQKLSIVWMDYYNKISNEY